MIESISSFYNKDHEKMYAVKTKCPCCGGGRIVNVKPEDWFKFDSLGLYVQDAFPYLSENEREAFLSGICSECWGKIFSGEDDEN